MSIIPCPTCNLPFVREGDMRNHHSNAHGESLAILTFVCDECGDAFEDYEKDQRGTDRSFCSSECYNQSRKGDE